MVDVKTLAEAFLNHGKGFDHNLYDAVDLSQYDLKNGAGTIHYHIYDNVWLVSYVEECGRRRCFRYEVVTK